MQTTLNNKILIIGAGDFSREFISFCDFDEKLVTICAKLDELDFKIGLLRDKYNKIYIAISNPLIRKKIFDKLKINNITPDSYVHSSVLVGRRTSIGIGCIIQPNSIISNDVVIKDSVFINCSSNIGHDVIIGDFCSLMANVNLGGHCKLGNNIFIGTGAILRPKVKINSNIKIGLGTVVVRNLKKQGSYFGNPAKLTFV